MKLIFFEARIENASLPMEGTDIFYFKKGQEDLWAWYKPKLLTIDFVIPIETQIK